MELTDQQRDYINWGVGRAPRPVSTYKWEDIIISTGELVGRQDEGSEIETVTELYQLGSW